jgi:hypothetical protein
LSAVACVRERLFSFPPFMHLFLGDDMRPFIALSLISLSLASFNSCKDTPPGPSAGPDTTSQHFTFSTWEYGDGGASAWASDVWIFDENNIWVVGLFPQTAQLPDEYNIMQWNGTEWKPRGSHFNSSGVDCIFALDSSTIYLASGIPIKYRNGLFTEYSLGYLGFSNGQSVNQIWASSESNVWGVGTNGCIVHFDGTSWSKIPFDLSYSFTAITGSKTTGIAYAVATSPIRTPRVVKISDQGVEVLFQGVDGGNQYSQDIKLLDESTLVLVGTPLRKLDIPSKALVQWYDNSSSSDYSINWISIAEQNDIFFFGTRPDRYGFMHYNGKRFSSFALPPRTGYFLHGSAAISNLAILASTSQNKAFLVFIRRGL